MTTEAPVQTSEAPTPEVQSAAPAQAPAQPPQQEQPQEPERPSWLPEKFTSPEALAAAYGELEKKLSGKSEAPAQTPQQAAEAANLPDPSTISEGDATFVLAQRGLDASQIADEYLSNGKLSDETYARLEKSGLPRPFVDGWIEGREAQAEQHRQRLYAEVGGEQTFSEVQSWAKANLSPQAIKAYNDAVSQGNVEVMALAMRGLHSRYIAAQGSRPELLGGDASPAGDGFASQADVVAAMRDPRYSKDPAYRAEVERKLSARNVLNVRTT